MSNEDAENKVTTIGITDWRETRIVFGIKQQDRFAHMLIIGKTGVGKSTLLFNMAMSDIANGNGIGVIDPHGDMAERIMGALSEQQRKEVIYFNAAQPNEHTVFNPLKDIAPEQYHLAAAEIISTFKKVWGDSWGPRLEYILRYSLLTLLYYPAATLLDIQRLLTDDKFRTEILSFVTDGYIQAFWYNEYDKYSPTLRNEAIASILNKTGSFIANKTLRDIVGKQKTISLESIINEKKIFIANLSKGTIGEEACSLLGSMLITGIQLAAFRRTSIAEHARVPFFLFIDEAPSFATSTFISFLSEVRKYKVGLFLAHQYLEQFEKEIQSALFGNVGTLICFQVGIEDAEKLSKELYPVFSSSDLVNLPRFSMYIKLMIDGVVSRPFSSTLF